MKDRRLLLIAMSGVRVRDQELLELGMTLPGFVERSEVIASLPSLSLLTVASHTPDNWEIVYKEIDDIDLNDLELLYREDFDLVGISAFTARIFDAYKVADLLRSQGVKVVLGGIHVSVLPKEASKHADCLVIGEAESVWPKVISDFEEGSLKASYNSNDVQPKFHFRDSLIPRYDLLDIDKYNRITLQTTRGCPLDCSFCAASRLISKYKIKPIDSIRKELETILSLWPNAFIELADDNTFFDKRWGRVLADLFSEYDFRWFTETDISIAEDETLLEKLALSGCAQVLIGLESSSASSLRGVDSSNWKLSKYETYLKQIELIQSYGISVNGCFILGFDSDNCDTFKETFDFVSESGLSEVQITLLTPFPGTKLYQELKQSKRLISDVFWDRCTLFDTTFIPKQMSVEELETGFRWLMSELFSREEVQKRKSKFRKCIGQAKALRGAIQQ